MIKSYGIMEKFDYLIRVPNHLGDTIMAQPSIKAFVQSNLDYKMALLIPDWATAIYSGLDNCGLFALDPIYLHGLSAINYQITLLRNFKIENGILLTPSFSSALIFFLGGVKNRFGYTGNYRNWLLNKSIKIGVDSTVHRSQKYRSLLERVAQLPIEISTPIIQIPDLQKNIAAEILAANDLNQSDKYLVIAPSAVAESRRWGTENYARLSKKIADNFDVKIILIGTQDQYLAGSKIAGTDDRIKNLCGKTNIIRAAAILAGARLFIGNDSGLAHLASAVDIPLVILSGADNPDETSPISNRKEVIIKKQLECISCVKNRCPKGGQEFMKCMTEISVDEVFQAVSERLT